jgi:protein-S-isoprenylcysteine O-methyltransferase Ste14
VESNLLWLIVSWLAYFVVHSLLASLTVKHRVALHFPGWMPGYRLFFNIVAMLLLIVPLYQTWAIGGEFVFVWQGGWQWLGNALALAAVIGFLYSLRHYDGSEFLGLRQLKDGEKRVEDQESFCISPLHQHVRHPWYFLGLILIWTRDMTMAMLVSSIMMTLYFIIGSWMEERKLLHYYGEAYAEYCRRVPGLLPLPWRNLSREQACKLERMGNRNDQGSG